MNDTIIQKDLDLSEAAVIMARLQTEDKTSDYQVVSDDDTVILG